MTPENVTQFKQDGYFIDRNVFDADELAALRELAGRVQATAKQHQYPGTRFWYAGHERRDDIPAAQRAEATWGINELPRKELFEPKLVDVFAHPRVHAAMHALLDQPRAWGIKMLWNPRLYSYDLRWHRDQVPRELYDWCHHKPQAQDHVQFNAALEPDNCFLVVPGSHRRALTQQEWHALEHEKTAKLDGEVVAELEPGDILYMDAHALHRGRCDKNTPRLTLHYSAQSQWVPLKPWGHDGHFDWITSDAFIEQLQPDTRPYYQRLRDAERTEDAMGFMRDAAVVAGWK